MLEMPNDLDRKKDHQEAQGGLEVGTYLLSLVTEYLGRYLLLG